jgi:hypothetical protein
MNEELIQFIKENPEIEECFLEMMEIAKDKREELNNGDDAEEAVVGAIRVTGKRVLQEWANRKAKIAEQRASRDPNLRFHEKKISDGKPH